MTNVGLTRFATKSFRNNNHLVYIVSKLLHLYLLEFKWMQFARMEGERPPLHTVALYKELILYNNNFATSKTSLLKELQREFNLSFTQLSGIVNEELYFNDPEVRVEDLLHALRTHEFNPIKLPRFQSLCVEPASSHLSAGAGAGAGVSSAGASATTGASAGVSTATATAGASADVSTATTGATAGVSTASASNCVLSFDDLLSHLITERANSQQKTQGEMDKLRCDLEKAQDDLKHQKKSSNEKTSELELRLTTCNADLEAVQIKLHLAQTQLDKIKSSFM